MPSEVEPRRFESLPCLSPFDKRRGRWVPLAALQDQEHADLLQFFLRELKLLGGLSAGNNGLTLQTVRALSRT